MMEIGKGVIEKVKGDKQMIMDWFMMVNSQITNAMVTEYLFMQMARRRKEIG